MTPPILPEEIWAIACDGNGLGDLVLTEDAECGPTPIVSTSESATARQIAKLSDGRRCRPVLVAVNPRYRKQSEAYRHMLLTLAGMVPANVAHTIRDLVAWGDAEDEACGKSCVEGDK
jgi:hypothetical protein